MSTQDMNDKQTELVSGLVDGELDEHSTDEVISYLEQDAQARGHWMRYHVISDVIKGHGSARVDSGFADRVSAALADEPVVLAPRRKKAIPAFIKQASGFAVAATVAVVAVLAVQPQNGLDKDAQQLADAEPTANSEWVRVVNTGVNWNVEQPSVESKLNAYLVNHNGYSSGVRGILPYAPIVSYDSSTQMKYEDAAPVEYKEKAEK
jgi:sigma-E factor negative regulatory protein RseA